MKTIVLNLNPVSVHNIYRPVINCTSFCDFISSSYQNISTFTRTRGNVLIFIYLFIILLLLFIFLGAGFVFVFFQLCNVEEKVTSCSLAGALLNEF